MMNFIVVKGNLNNNGFILENVRTVVSSKYQ